MRTYFPLFTQLHLYQLSLLPDETPSYLSQSPASHCASLGSNPGLSAWDLWWTKWQWDTCSCKYLVVIHPSCFTMLVHSHVMNAIATGSHQTQLQYLHHQHNVMKQSQPKLLTLSIQGNVHSRAVNGLQTKDITEQLNSSYKSANCW
jgi:hypothetical protein